MIAHRRDHGIALSAEALALAWARQEDGPAGATIVADREISPRGRHGRVWDHDPAQSVALAVVLRPALPTDQSDGLWLASGLAVADAIEDSGGPAGSVWWPDQVCGTAEAEVAMVKVQAQLGTGGVRMAVVTARVDLVAASLEPGAREALVEAVRRRLLERSGQLEAAPDQVADEYGHRCPLTGRHVKVGLLPSGEARGEVRGVRSTGALVLAGRSGALDQIPVDALRDLAVVDRHV